MCFDYDGYWKFYDDSFPVARKQHKCGECDLPILPGERYHQHRGMWEDQFASHKVCSFCDWLISRVASAEMEAGCRAHESYPPFGGLYEALSDGHAREIGLVDLLTWHEDHD